MIKYIPVLDDAFLQKPTPELFEKLVMRKLPLSIQEEIRGRIFNKTAWKESFDTFVLRRTQKKLRDNKPDA
jgi:hypothetical protein